MAEIAPCRIAVVGAGGVGGFFGGRLARAGHDVTFIARGATLQALRTSGLRVDSFQGDFTVDRVPATDDPSTVGPVDAVLVAVKSWQVPEVARSLGPLIAAQTAVVPLENGLEAPDHLIAALGSGNVLGGLCAIVSFVVSPGHIRHAAFDPIVAFGELDGGRSERAERLLDAFKTAAINADIPPDIRRSMWTKFLFIAPMSGIGAVSRVPVGVWRTTPATRSMAEGALREIVALASARGIDLGADAIEKTMERYDALDAEATASLQRDVMQGKPSELDGQIAAVVRMGKTSGVPTPIHDFILASLLPQENAARAR